MPSVEPQTIDEAWARAEERLGEYWRIRSLNEASPKGWEAVASSGTSIRVGRGPTPLAALVDLAK